MPTAPPAIRPAKLREMTSRCACLNARKATRLLSQVYDAALRPAGVRSTQLPILATLGLRGPLPITELADAVAVDRTTLSRSLALLERNQWVRSRPGGDLRIRELSLTLRGQDVVRRAVPLWEKAQASVSALFGGAGAERLIADFAVAADRLRGLAPADGEGDG